MVTPKFVYSIRRHHSDGTAVLESRRVLKADHLWVWLAHRIKVDRLERVLRGACIFSEHEAWRRHLTRANKNVMDARRQVRYREQEILRAKQHLGKMLIERDRIRGLIVSSNPKRALQARV